MQLDDLFFGVHCDADHDKAIKNTNAETRWTLCQIAVQKRERLLLYYREAENKLMNGKFWLEEALKLGEKRAALLLGNLYRNGTLISEKDLDKAWHYYHRGFQMHDYECARMCALMIDCGEKKDAPHRMDYYLGWADRFVK